MLEDVPYTEQMSRRMAHKYREIDVEEIAHTLFQNRQLPDAVKTRIVEIV